MVCTGKDMALAAQLIREGKLVAFPTETVYGLGADAFNAATVARVFETKERPSFDPLIVHISSIDQLDELFLGPIDPRVYKLAEAFWPGPLTIVHNKQPHVPDLVTSGLSTVAVRMPSHPMALELIRQSGKAVAAPSANKFGCLSPTKAEHVIKQLKTIDYVLDGGATTIGVESTVVSVSEAGVKILRHGAIIREAIANVVDVIDEKDKVDTQGLPAPGMIKSHYSPLKPLYILKEGIPETLPAGSGIIVNDARVMPHLPEVKNMALSQDGDLNEMAVNLFATLHAMEDDEQVREIYIQPVEEKGIGRAIMDRLRKASYNYQK
ncbi:MAG: threonylcarbamoyl-AMP synthase [Marinilabiliaceae bacterium]|nr:threonylcarbamoyl-AMP synthase [Marinilabiliaceae bacterium]